MHGVYSLALATATPEEKVTMYRGKHSCSTKQAPVGRRQARHRPRVLFCWLIPIFLLWAGLASCQFPVTSTASEISIKGLCGLSPERFTQSSQVEIREWLQKEYGTSPDLKDLGEGITSIRAEGKAGRYTTVFQRNGRTLEILRTITNGPTLGQIVTVFGTPESVYGFRLMNEVIRYSVGFDYPQHGISVFIDKNADHQRLTHEGRFEVQIDEGFQVDLVSCFMPRASMDEVLRNGYPSDPKNIEYNLNRRKPWSGFGVWVPLEP